MILKFYSKPLAAHCIPERDASILRVVIGEWDTKTTNEIYGHVEHEVHSLVAHPEYHKGALHNDIALLFLKTPVKFEPNIAPICLPDDTEIFDHQKCFVAGWGKDRFGKEGLYQNILKKIEVPVVPSAKCEAALRTTRLGRRFQLGESFICAGGESGQGKKVCD